MTAEDAKNAEKRSGIKEKKNGFLLPAFAGTSFAGMTILKIPACSAVSAVKNEIKKRMSEKTITIFGTAKAVPGDTAYTLAYKVGKLLAQAGFTIANGGYGGTMLAAAKGAAEAGGKIIGVTCSAFKGSKANEYISREIVADSLDERLDTLMKLGQAYIVLPGGTGTLLELAKVWELKNKGFLDTDKPIILVGGYWQPLLDLIAADDPDSSRYIKQADGPEQVVELIPPQADLRY